jgi:hypothetical protein
MRHELRRYKFALTAESRYVLVSSPPATEEIGQEVVSSNPARV